MCEIYRVFTWFRNRDRRKHNVTNKQTTMGIVTVWAQRPYPLSSCSCTAETIHLHRPTIGQTSWNHRQMMSVGHWFHWWHPSSSHNLKDREISVFVVVLPRPVGTTEFVNWCVVPPAVSWKLPTRDRHIDLAKAISNTEKFEMAVCLTMIERKFQLYQ